MTDLLTRTSRAPGPLAPSLDQPVEVDAPASVLADSLTARLAIGVAPSTGRFRPQVGAGARVLAGELLGEVTGGAGRADAVYAPVSGQVSALLVRPGQLVGKGRGLVWLLNGETPSPRRTPILSSDGQSRDGRSRQGSPR